MKQAFIHGIILDGSQEMTPQDHKIILTDGEKIEGIVSEDTDLKGYTLSLIHIYT